MPKIQILSERSDGGAKSIHFVIDGKRYVALPKLGNMQDRLDDFKKLLEFCSKYNLNPYATPLKSDPVKADKYKKMRMFDRVKYSWNDDTSTKEGRRAGLKEFIDVVPKENLDTFLAKRQPPDSEQMKLVLSGIATKLQSKKLLKTADRITALANSLR